MQTNVIKIAVISVHSSPMARAGAGYTGGMSIYILELVHELVKKGHVVDVYTRRYDPGSSEIIDIAPNARLIHIDAGEPAVIDKRLVYSHLTEFTGNLENCRRRSGMSYDLVFSHYWLSAIVGLNLRKLWHVPHVMMFHTLAAVKNTLGIGEDEPEYRIENERAAAQASDLIIATTENEKYFLNQRYGIPMDRIAAIPCGVNLELFRPMNKLRARQELGIGQGKIILFVGRIERLKGIDQLIRALPYLSDIRPRLLIVGEDGNRRGEANNLKKLTENLNCAGLVIFVGIVEYGRLPLYYNAADVCILPSYYESFGLTPLEALACGTPVVANDVGALRKIVRQGETGYVVKDNQPHNLADGIEAVLSGALSDQGTSVSIRESICRFDWRNVADSVIGEFGRLIERRTVRTPIEK